MLSTIVWLQTAKETRKKIAANLGVPRSSGFDVQGGVVVSDGYTPNDLSHITIEKLKEATGLDISDFYGLYEKYVLQLETSDTVKPEEVTTPFTSDGNQPPVQAETLFPVEPIAKVAPNAQFQEIIVKKPRTK